MHASSQSRIRSDHTWQDIAAFISLAAAAGLACGIVFAGITLLLSTPAYGAEPEGTLILRPLTRELDPHSAIRVAPLSTQAGYRIDEGMAEAHVVQTFRNPSSASYDAIYAMSLPKDAAVERLRVRVGERLLELDPLESVTSNLLALEIKDIGPLQAVIVEIDYVEPLLEDERAAARLPVLTGPRRPVSTAL